MDRGSRVLISECAPRCRQLQERVTRGTLTMTVTRLALGVSLPVRT